MNMTNRDIAFACVPNTLPGDVREGIVNAVEEVLEKKDDEYVALEVETSDTVLKLEQTIKDQLEEIEETEAALERYRKDVVLSQKLLHELPHEKCPDCGIEVQLARQEEEIARLKKELADLRKQHE